MKTAPVSEHTTKHLVRAWLERRAREQQPPPSLEEIRRQLGWGLLERGLRVGPAIPAAPDAEAADEARAA